MSGTITPRPVFCVVEHAHRDRQIAENVCQGRFSHQGRTLDLGVEPDWLGAVLPPDPEWRLEWSKFYYGLDLAWAFRVTGDDRFLTTWRRLVLSWIRQVSVECDPCDVIGRRIQNWIYAWCSFAASARFTGLSAVTAEAIVESLRTQVAHLRAHLTRERNHRTLELYALFIAALALPSIDPNGQLLTYAIDQLRDNLLRDVGPDGVQRERSTHYHHVALRSFLGARENARRFGLEFGPEFDDRLGRACDFAMYVHRPDGSIPALSDSDTGSYLDLLALAADLFGRADWKYVATRGRQGTAPTRTSVSFPNGGYFVQRSGWGSERSFGAERFLIFDCGPIGDGGHGHYDALSIDVASRRPLAVDPGRFTYCDDTPHWRRWFKSTAAHNTVTIDGRDQTPYHRGKPKRGTAEARLVERVTTGDLDVLCGEVVSPAYEVIHRRRILFVRRQYWIVHDSLIGAEPHTYALRFHLAPADADRPLVTIAEGNGIRTAGLELIMSPPWPMTIEDGWVSPTYGIKEQAPVIVATAEGTPSAEFFSLLMPIDEELLSAVRFDISRLVIDEELIVADVAVQTRAGISHDRVIWAVSGGVVSLTDVPQVASRGAMA